MSHKKIDVTQEDIDHGKPLSYRLCPIARALSRQGFPNPVVKTNGFSYDLEILNDLGRNKRCIVALPPDATRFIGAYDFGYPVSPFSFMIEVCK